MMFSRKPKALRLPPAPVDSAIARLALKVALWLPLITVGAHLAMESRLRIQIAMEQGKRRRAEIGARDAWLAYEDLMRAQVPRMGGLENLLHVDAHVFHDRERPELRVRIEFAPYQMAMLSTDRDVLHPSQMSAEGAHILRKVARDLAMTFADKVLADAICQATLIKLGLRRDPNIKAGF